MTYSRWSPSRFLADLIISVKCGILLSVRLLFLRLWERTDITLELVNNVGVSITMNQCLISGKIKRLLPLTTSTIYTAVCIQYQPIVVYQVHAHVIMYMYMAWQFVPIFYQYWKKQTCSSCHMRTSHFDHINFTTLLLLELVNNVSVSITINKCLISGKIRWLPMTTSTIHIAVLCIQQY